MRRPFVAGRTPVALVAALSVAVLHPPARPCGPPAPARVPPGDRRQTRRRAEGRAARPRRRPTAAGRAPTDAERRKDRPVPAPGGELGRQAARGRVRGRVVRSEGRRQAGAGQREGRGHHEGGRRGAARQLQRLQDHGVQLPDAAQGADAGGGGRDRQGDPGRGPRDRLDRVLASWTAARSSPRTSKA
jgi:hypothetical protein